MLDHLGYFNVLEDINGDGVCSGRSRISQTTALNLGTVQLFIWPFFRNEKKMDTERVGRSLFSYIHQRCVMFILYFTVMYLKKTPVFHP